MPDLEKLLALELEEEHYFLEAHQSRINFYSSIIAALIGGTIAGAIKVEDKQVYLFLISGPIIVYVLGHLARKGTERFYQRYLESVFTRAKIEQAMGLTKVLPSAGPACEYWTSESFIPLRFIKARKERATSEEFVNSRLKRGYQQSTNNLFYAFQVIAVAMAVGLILIYLYYPELQPPRSAA